MKDFFVVDVGITEELGGSESPFAGLDAAMDDGVEITNWAGVVIVFQEILVDNFPVPLMMMGVLDENEESSIFDISCRLLCLACDRVSEPMLKGRHSLRY